MGTLILGLMIHCMGKKIVSPADAQLWCVFRPSFALSTIVSIVQANHNIYTDVGSWTLACGSRPFTRHFVQTILALPNGRI